MGLSDMADGTSYTPTAPSAPSGTSLPGKVEAEDYSSMSGVQTEYTLDAGGGKNVGWIDPNDWMDYSVNPGSTGSYTVNFRVATPSGNSQFQLRKADGTVLATVSVPNTWGYQTWQTVLLILPLLHLLHPAPVCQARLKLKIILP